MLHNLRVLIHDAAMIQKKPYEDEIEARLIPRTPVPSQRLATQATILKNSPQTPKRQKIVDPVSQHFSAPMKLQRTTSASPTPRFGHGCGRDSLFVEASSNNGASLGETQCPLSSSLKSATLSGNATFRKFVRPSSANVAEAQQTSHAPVVEFSTTYQNSHAVFSPSVATQHRSVSLHSVSPVIDLLLGEDSESINYLYQDSVVSRIVDAVVKREKSNANLNTTKFFYLNGVMHDFRVNESHAMAKRLNAVYDSLPQDSTRLRRGLDESLQPLVRYNKLKFAELSDHFFVKEKLEYPVLELLRYDDPSLPQPLEMPRNTCSLKGKTTMDRLLEALRSRVSKLVSRGRRSLRDTNRSPPRSPQRYDSTSTRFLRHGGREDHQGRSLRQKTRRARPGVHYGASRSCLGQCFQGAARLSVHGLARREVGPECQGAGRW
ncbi:hypothetical protein BJ546DRAFT_257657 [Cryomyces antarcticus]